MELTHQRYLAVTLPFVLSATAVSVIGAVDTAVVGRLGSPDYISAVALGAVIFSTIYWLLGFLRITTAGLTAQALGKHADAEIFFTLLRALLLALLLGILLLAGRQLIFAAAIAVLQPQAQVALLMQAYFEILVWGFVPFLLYQVLAGWLTGLLRVKTVVLIELGINLLNFILDLLLVNVWHFTVNGVAYASLIAQITGFATAAGYFCITNKHQVAAVSWRLVFVKAACLKLMGCCTHLLIRTVCMLLMVNIFMSQSAVFGGSIMAANAILFQIQYIMGDVFAGMSQTAALYAGLAVGENSRTLFLKNLKISGLWALLTGSAMSLGYYLLREQILYCFTNLPSVLAEAVRYDLYIAFFPVIAALGIVYYGIFNGALVTGPICYSMLLTIAVFLLAKIILVPTLGNVGLWQAFLVFYVGRTGFLLVFVPFLKRKLGFSTVVLPVSANNGQ